MFDHTHLRTTLYLKPLRWKHMAITITNSKHSSLYLISKNCKYYVIVQNHKNGTVFLKWKVLLFMYETKWRKRLKLKWLRRSKRVPHPLKRYISFMIAHQYIDKIFRVLNPFSYRTRCYTNQFQNIFNQRAIGKRPQQPNEHVFRNWAHHQEVSFFKSTWIMLFVLKYSKRYQYYSMKNLLSDQLTA